MIHLIGPGGAGKSTTGRILADLLECPFRDLDRAFEERVGDIDDYIERRGYTAYARRNVETYLTIATDGPGVVALSSGFMTYFDDTHSALRNIRRSIAMQPSTVVLLPSLDLEECVAETLRRQRARPLAHRRTASREEEVIRERFALYMALPARRITTMRRAADIAAEITSLIGLPSAFVMIGRLIGG